MSYVADGWSTVFSASSSLLKKLAAVDLFIIPVFFEPVSDDEPPLFLDVLGPGSPAEVMAKKLTLQSFCSFFI